MEQQAFDQPWRSPSIGGRAQATQLRLDLGPDFEPALRPADRLVGSAHRSSVAVSVDVFHRLFSLPSRRTPGLEGVPEDLLRLRYRLLYEETNEFAEAARARDLTAMADALADLVYVAYGTAISMGIDLDDVLAEVHRSNMSKLGSDGRPVMRDDGKVLKPSTYEGPNVAHVLERQPPLPAPSHRS